MATNHTFPKVSQHWLPLPVVPCRIRPRGGGGSAKACSSRGTNGSRDSGGRLVDENMIVLRMRIRDAKMLERSTHHDHDDHNDRLEWMDWEKQYFVNYQEDVLEGIGLLQNWLMNTRPSLALGFLALFTMSVTISSSFVIFYVIEITKQIVFKFLL
ncbi:hypothetical protein L484_027125 [Morus notabilis]|uniref:Uncharacterized protein n=1 Tax=Morus notabilis TaxID=981085 RepID=W9SQ76_9ROSA|nr:hypothetical protein L484_027125 [Morus notabilis]